MTTTSETPRTDDELWTRSCFSELSTDDRKRLLYHSITTSAAAGDVVNREVGGLPLAARTMLLVTRGVIRTYVESPDRQVTFRYATAGDVIGLCTFMSARHAPMCAQAVTDVDFLRLSAPLVTGIMSENAAYARALLDAVLATQAKSMLHLFDNVFRSVKSRVAAHIVELAAVDEHGQLSVELSHQHIADAIGSVREVVSRAISELTALGAIERHGNRILLAELSLLRAVSLGEGENKAPSN